MDRIKKGINGKYARRQVYSMKKSCSCIWTGTVDSSSDYRSISTERKQFSHTSDIAGVSTAKKRKRLLQKKWRNATTHGLIHFMNTVVDRNYRTINLNSFTLMVAFLLKHTSAKPEWMQEAANAS